jgi:hypothetical protein
MINGNGKIGDTVNAGRINTGNSIENNFESCSIVENRITVNVGQVNAVQPKLSFQLEKNPDYKGLGTQYGESEYCIFCRNDDKQAIRIKRIFLNDGQETIYKCKILDTVDFVIASLGSYTHHISYADLCDIKNYYRKHQIKECTIIVDTSEGEYRSNFDLTYLTYLT